MIRYTKKYLKLAAAAIVFLTMRYLSDCVETHSGNLHVSFCGKQSSDSLPEMTGNKEESMEQKSRKKCEDMEQRYETIPSLEEVTDNPYIYRYNHELCEKKGLSEGDRLSRLYLCMQAVYRANLDAYLLETLDIRSLDEELKNSGLGFVSQKPENMNLYGRESAMGLEFVYLRNNLYIEYLEEDQLELLKEQLEAGKPAVTEEIKKMAEATCREVIRVRNPGDWEDESDFLYSEAQGCKPRIPNRALVLAISNVMRYDAAGNLLPNDCGKEKYEYLDKIKKEKEREYSGILGMEVYILME